MRFKFSIVYIVSFFYTISALSQAPNATQYKGLLWEITGNGLKKPSYLFGTMHVSSKLAFHLSDSFYYALKNVDAVALELNPESWQSQMMGMNELNQNYADFVRPAGNDYLNENSFRLKKFDKSLKEALGTEPPVVNNLLYRTYKAKDDFEEDTFLDLYIFQTGRKLGKKAAGVEDYYESEKLLMEAYSDMAREKEKKKPDLNGESISSLIEKMQNAYRRADLDLMDSLDNALEKSPAFREKFLYRRNEIQADAIDSIIKKTALFVGVGAAHLPGNRGVIALLRGKGYTLRPVMMPDRDTKHKEEIHKLKVPVSFSRQESPDAAFSVDVPGPLYSVKGEYPMLDRHQYADMSNGSYYLVTRVKTNAALLNINLPGIEKKIDSLLYENIPGKILFKKSIVLNGYRGFDISNRTRRGDLQRYQIFITPYEVIIFKMSGKNDYVDGAEARSFFSSIQLKSSQRNPVKFTPSTGGFSISLPQEPHRYFNRLEDDRYEFEAMDPGTNEAYLVMKRTVYNFNFLEEDSFDLSLVEKSFRSPDYFDKQLSRKYSTVNGYPALLVREKLKNGSVIHAAHVLQGPHYYVIAKRVQDDKDSSFRYLDSFTLEPFIYEPTKKYTDSFLRVTVNTPVIPNIDNGVRTILEQAQKDNNNGVHAGGYMRYWTKPGRGLFKSEATGEIVAMQVQEYPVYYYIKDSSEFWNNIVKEYTDKAGMVLHKQIALQNPGSAQGMHLVIRDTGSSRQIERLVMLKGRNLYSMMTITDTAGQPSALTASMFSSIEPSENVEGNLYDSKLDLFFNDLFSTDSALHKRAHEFTGNVYFGPAASGMLMQAIERLSMQDKDYVSVKLKLIEELGFIKNSQGSTIPLFLAKQYYKTADTSLFQNEIIKSLARLKTKSSIAILKELMLQDPPIFENSRDYNNLFGHLQDSLELSKHLFPQLLQLTSIDDYKENIIDLLVLLADKGHVNVKEYSSHFKSIFLDAKVALKKQLAREEKQLKVSITDPENEDYVAPVYGYNNDNSALNDYASLLAPFLKKNKQVQQFFEKLSTSKNDNIRLNTSIVLLRHGYKVPDSLLYNLAAKDATRSMLYSKLEEFNLLGYFPKTFKTQENMARSLLYASNDLEKIDSLELLKSGMATVKGNTGRVYFYRFKIKKSDDWKLAISGLQPFNTDSINVNDDMVWIAEKKIQATEPIEEQMNNQLEKLLFGFRKSAKQFYVSDSRYLESVEDYED